MLGWGLGYVLQPFLAQGLVKTPESQPRRIRSRSNSLSPPSEMDVDTTPAQSSEPMKSNESNQKADELNEVVYGLLTKVNYVEKRRESCAAAFLPTKKKADV